MAPIKTTFFTPPNIADDAAVDYDYDPILHLSRKSLQQIANLLYFASAPPHPPHHTSSSSPSTTTSTTSFPSTIYVPPNPSSTASPNPRKPILKTTSTSLLPPPWLTAQRDAVDALTAADPHCPLLARRHPAVRAVRRLVPLYRRGLSGLCRAHEGLDGEVVGGLLRLVKVEVGVRCDVVRYWGELRGGGRGRGRGRGEKRGERGVDGDGVSGEEERDGLARRTRMRWMVQVLSGVGSLFLDEDDFGRYFGDGVRPECWFEKVESGCPACMLAVVGGRQEVLMALRANLKGRAKNREPRLLGLVEAWMSMFGRDEEREMRAQSDALAVEVNDVRQWMHDRKVRKRGERAARGEPEDRRKPPGELPSGTKFIDGVPMPNYRMLDRVRQHHGSKDRGGSPTDKKAVDGVSRPRSDLPADGHQHRDSIIYQAPTTPAGWSRRVVDTAPPLNGTVWHQESWTSIISSQTISPVTPITPSSYTPSSVYITPSSSQPHLTPSITKPNFAPPPSSSYLTPSTSNPWFKHASSNLDANTPPPPAFPSSPLPVSTRLAPISHLATTGTTGRAAGPRGLPVLGGRARTRRAIRRMRPLGPTSMGLGGAEWLML